MSKPTAQSLPSGAAGAKPCSAAIPLSRVLREEYATVRPEWRDAIGATPEEDDEARARGRLFAIAHEPPGGARLAALCFSGGGIRSATFNLGVLQGLATRGLLDRFDYLSSVSGGGYISSWLAGWIHRRGTLASIRAELEGPQGGRIDPEAHPLRHLRAYGNYLTPRLGLLSLDTWTAIVLFVRNLLLNWLVLVPILAGVLALPLLAIASWRPCPSPGGSFAVGLVLGTIGLVFMNGLRAVASEEVDGRRTASRLEWFVPLGLLPLLAGTVLIVAAVGSVDSASSTTFGDARWWPWCALLGLGMPLGAFVVSIPVQWGIAKGRHVQTPDLALVALDGAALLVVGVIETMLYAGVAALWAGAWTSWPHHAGVMLGPVLVLGPLLLGKTLFVALSSLTEGSRRESEYGDALREWWARWSAWIVIALVTWVAVSAVAFLSPWLLRIAWLRLTTYLGTVSLGPIISWLGKGVATPGKDPREGGGWTQFGITLGVPVFCVLLAMLISTGTQALIVAMPVGAFRADDAVVLPPLAAIVVVGVLLASGLVAGAFVNVNRFSLQALYRNRLVRAYLGASNIERRPNFFTGFDPADNLRLATLQANRPFPVINMALNLVAGANLAWQERMAESFTATPLHAGCPELGYRPASAYGGRNGISIGTAVAVSGAAANPSMGCNSSPAVTFVMTLFNARLGAWLGNPRGGRFHSDGPRLSSPYWMVAEALGLTHDAGSYVNLSDGGHFENLGLYEMVRRRCGFILVCDAGQDVDCRFDDLGNAIRKIRIDLGIPIRFLPPGIPIFSKAEGSRQPRRGYCAIGTIGYGEVDAGAPAGTLVYLKPAIVGDEPCDVSNYARASKEFPHETTADQWFSESQFESYRALGKFEVLTISGGGSGGSMTLTELQEAVSRYLDRTPRGSADSA